MEYHHFRKKMHLQSGSISHSYVSLPGGYIILWPQTSPGFPSRTGLSRHPWVQRHRSRPRPNLRWLRRYVKPGTHGKHTQHMAYIFPRLTNDQCFKDINLYIERERDGEWWRDIPSSTGWNRGFPSRIPTYSFLLPSPRTLFMPFHSFPSPRNPSFQDCLANHTYNVACLVLNPFLEPTTCRTCQQAVMSSCELVGSGKTW